MTSTVGATDLSKINRIKVRMSYEALVGGDFASTSTDALVPKLEALFAKGKKDPRAELDQCDVCKGYSDAAMSPGACPYCNDGLPVGGEADDGPAPVRGIEPEPEEKDEDSAVPASRPVVDAEPEPPDATSIDATAIAAAAADAAKPGAKASKEDVAERKMVRRLPAIAPRPSTPLVALAGGKSPLAGAKDLEESILRYYRASHSMADGQYAMGKELVRMRDHLWQQRLGTDSKPKYKTFEQFIGDELKTSKTVAYRLIQVAENFSEEQFRAYGPEVLKMLASAPKEMHAALMSQVDQGTTTRELREEIREANKAKGVEVAPPPDGRPLPKTHEATIAAKKAREEKKAKEERAKKRESAAITVGLKNASGTIQAYARGALPGRQPAKDGKEKLRLSEAAAQELRDLKAYFVEEGINGVKVAYVLEVDAAGVVTVKRDAKRFKDEDEAAA